MADNSSMTSIPTGGPIQGEYSGTGAIACCAFFIAFCTIFVGLRLWAKYLSASRWGWDDYLLIPCLFLVLFLYSTFIYMLVNAGCGYHDADVMAADPNLIILYAKLMVLNTVMFSIVLSLPRCCILATYLRIFIDKRLRILTWTLLALTIIYATSSVIVSLLQCVPLAALWDPNISGVCLDEQAWYGYGTIPVAVFDVATMALPVSTILQLKRPLHERMGLLGTFLAYGIATCVEIARIVTFNVTDQNDDHWAFPSLAIVSVCEVSAYVLACCMPGLRPLWLRWKGQSLSSSKQSSGYVRSSRSAFGRNTAAWSGYQLDSSDRPERNEDLEANSHDATALKPLPADPSRSDVIEVAHGHSVE